MGLVTPTGRSPRLSWRPDLPSLPSPYCRVIATEKKPLLSPTSLSFTPSISVQSADILTARVLEPIGKGALLPTRAMSPATGIAPAG